MKKNYKECNKDCNMSGTATFFFQNQIEYASIPKYYLRDKRLSMKAKGLLTIMYTLPDEWEYNMKGLCKITNLTLKQVRTILKELEFFRYLERSQKQDDKGRFRYEYFIFIEPYALFHEDDEEAWEEAYMNSPYYQKGHTVKRYTEY